MHPRSLAIRRARECAFWGFFMPKPSFPEILQSARLGQMVLAEDPCGDDFVSRTYSPVDPVVVAGVKEQLRVIAWPPNSGVENADAFARYIDQVWDSIWTRFDAILAAAIPVVEEEISRSYEDDDPDRPAAAPMLQRNLLWMFKIDGTFHPRNSHELMFVASEFMGGHDLGLLLDRELMPKGAYFGG